MVVVEVVENGIYFELDISPLFLTPKDVGGGRSNQNDSSSSSSQPGPDVLLRRMWLSQVQTFLHFTGGKNIIITSGTNSITKCHSLNELKLLLIGARVPYKHLEEYTLRNVLRVIDHSMARDVNKGVVQFTLASKLAKQGSNNNNKPDRSTSNPDNNKNNNRNNSFKNDRTDRNNENNKKQRNR